MTARHRHSGFTLVELIVATTLTVMIAGSTLLILRGVSTARRGLDRQMAVQQQARVAIRAITTALRNGCRSGKLETKLVGLAGDPRENPSDRFRLFVVSRRTIRTGKPESDVKEMEFFLRGPRTNSPPGLMRRTDPTRNELPDGGGVLECVAENVVAMELKYHDGVRWRPDWPEKMRTWPLAVRIRLVIATKEWPSGWPVIRVVTFPHHPAAGAKPDSEDGERPGLDGEPPHRHGRPDERALGPDAAIMDLTWGHQRDLTHA